LWTVECSAATTNQGREHLGDRRKPVMQAPKGPFIQAVGDEIST
jgi:hypothetical protein